MQQKLTQLSTLLLLAILTSCTSSNSIKQKEAKAPSASFPKPMVWKTLNGMRVWSIESNDIPIIDMQLTFVAGSAQDKKLPGLASMTNELIFQGSKNLTEQQINEEIDNLGAEIGGSSQRDMGIITVRCLSGTVFNKCLQLLEKIIKKPIFSLNNITRSVESRIIGLKEAQKQPSTIANKLFWENVFINHPYSSPPAGTLESIKKIKSKHLRKFFSTYYTAQNASLVLIGNIKPQQAKKIAERISRRLPQGSKVLGVREVKTKLKRKLIEYPLQTSQNHIRIGFLGVKRQDPNYVAFYLANHAMGGGALNSILGDEIREKRGWAYSVGSYNLPMLATGPFISYMQTKNENSKAAIKLVTNIFSKSQNYFTNETINRSRSYLLGNFPLQLDSNAKILSYMSVLSFYNLPTNYLNNFYNKLKTVTNSEVRHAWQSVIDSKEMISINVGKITK